jgi:hypothetical protein
MGMDKLIKNNRHSFEFHFVCESSKQEITKTVVEKEYFRRGGYLRPFASDKGLNKFHKMAFLFNALKEQGRLRNRGTNPSEDACLRFLPILFYPTATGCILRKFGR